MRLSSLKLFRFSLTYFVGHHVKELLLVPFEVCILFNEGLNKVDMISSLQTQLGNFNESAFHYKLFKV